MFWQVKVIKRWSRISVFTFPTGKGPQNITRKHPLDTHFSCLLFLSCSSFLSDTYLECPTLHVHYKKQQKINQVKMKPEDLNQNSSFDEILTKKLEWNKNTETFVPLFLDPRKWGTIFLRGTRAPQASSTCPGSRNSVCPFRSARHRKAWILSSASPLGLISPPLHTDLPQSHQIIYEHLQVYYLAHLPLHQQFVSFRYFRG